MLKIVTGAAQVQYLSRAGQFDIAHYRKLSESPDRQHREHVAYSECPVDGAGAIEGRPLFVRRQTAALRAGASRVENVS